MHGACLQRRIVDTVPTLFCRKSADSVLLRAEVLTFVGGGLGMGAVE